MENPFLYTPLEVLQHFKVSEKGGLSKDQVLQSRKRFGYNAIPEDPPTPLWKLVLEQFKDQLVLILLGSAAVSFALALFEDSDDGTAFVDPIVVSS
jgi:Ca2+ transporting ATPase